MDEIYLDAATRAQSLPEARERHRDLLKQNWGTPAAPHEQGQRTLAPLEEAYGHIRALIDGKPTDSLVITGSGAEAINQVVETVYYEETRSTGKNGYLTANTDEAAAIMAIDRLQERDCVPKMVEVDSTGVVTPDAVLGHLTPRTALLSLSWGNALTGVVHPVAEIGDLCRERGVLFHLDVSHVLGKVYFERDDIGASYITASGDLLGSTPGTGFLWAREGVPLRPLIVGGGEQGGLRAGGWDVAGAAALGETARILLDQRDTTCIEIAQLRNRLEEGIASAYPEARPLFAEQERLPHISAIAFPGIGNEALQYALQKEKVYTSIGGGTQQQIALVLQAVGIAEERPHTALSFSVPLDTTEEQIDEAIERIVRTAKHLRSLSSAIVEVS